MAMSENTGSKVSYFLVGLGVGAILGVLFAPKSGEETREYLMDKAEEGRDYAKRKARELRERAEDVYERGKDVVSHQREQISSAIDAGKEAYQREKSKAL
jgi:gas vesicle protein